MNRLNHHLSESDETAAALRRKSLLRIFRSYFPESSSQVAVGVTFLCALVVSGLWMWWILENRWLEQQRHPTTIITREHLESIPMIEALVLNYWVDFFGSNGENLLFHMTETFHTGYYDFDRLSPNDIQCIDLALYGFSSACQPFINGQEAFPSTFSGKPRLDVSNWPLQYRNRADILQLVSHVLVNKSNIKPAGIY